MRFKGEHWYSILPQIHNLSLVVMNCERDKKIQIKISDIDTLINCSKISHPSCLPRETFQHSFTHFLIVNPKYRNEISGNKGICTNVSNFR